MIRAVLLGARLVIAAVFVVAGVLKLRDPAAFATDIANYQMMPALAPWLAIVLPSLEILVGLVLALAPSAAWRRSAALVAAGLMVVFTVAVVAALSRGINVACGCFGTGSGSLGALTVVRDLVLLAGCAALVVYDRSPAISTHSS